MTPNVVNHEPVFRLETTAQHQGQPVVVEFEPDRLKMLLLGGSISVAVEFTQILDLGLKNLSVVFGGNNQFEAAPVVAPPNKPRRRVRLTGARREQILDQIQALSDAGHSIRSIAQQLSMPKSSVYRLLQLSATEPADQPLVVVPPPPPEDVPPAAAPVPQPPPVVVPLKPPIAPVAHPINTPRPPSSGPVTFPKAARFGTVSNFGTSAPVFGQSSRKPDLTEYDRRLPVPRKDV